jgi:signal transduction histidine kinase
MTRANRHRKAAQRSQVKLDEVADILRENQKLITLGRLTASIAHEINNPLESITNLLYLMEVGKPEKSAEYLRMAQRELSRVVQISKQTLTFSRETSVRVRVQLAELMEEVLGLYTRKIGDKNLRIVRQYDTHEPVLVFPGEMRQVLSNLISNALEATDSRGRIIIRIRATRNWSGYNERGLRISIGDNGSGMSNEVLARLGEPFFTTKGQSGTGLGLWVTQSILTRYGGSLQIRSSSAPESHGTVFSLFLPHSLRPLAIVTSGSDADDHTAVPHSNGSGLRLVSHDKAFTDVDTKGLNDLLNSRKTFPARASVRFSGD